MNNTTVLAIGVSAAGLGFAYYLGVFEPTVPTIPVLPFVNNGFDPVVPTGLTPGECGKIYAKLWDNLTTGDHSVCNFIDGLDAALRDVPECATYNHNTAKNPEWDGNQAQAHTLESEFTGQCRGAGYGKKFCAGAQACVSNLLYGSNTGCKSGCQYP